MDSEIKNNSIRGRQLQGPRPSALRVASSTTTTMKKSSHANRNRISKVIKPVVIYLRSPKIIHVRPEEFMSVVQRLTGKPSSASSPMKDGEPMKKMSGRDSLFDGDDQVLGMSPTLLHSLACV
ncbi:hypothetical protein V6N13_137285 [Hibiscus sabdariffa]|uniref:VQ domain-containing protein n=1 Tax=Hibiscus sabdariffa TaxID=183260 RepID=A0ABR2DL49_9ROSI